MKPRRSPHAAGRTPGVFVLNLGCAKNQVDAEHALSKFRNRGYRLAGSPETADILLVNTCAFIAPAEKESSEALVAAAELKRTGRPRVLLAAGCLVARHGAQRLLRLLPEFDDALEPGNVDAWLASAERRLAPAGCAAVPARPERVLLSAPGTAYLKIAEGCRRRCRYCLIPKLRGPLRSRPMDQLWAEAEQLGRQGVRELIVVAQDITDYGRDRGGLSRLAILLRGLVRVPRIRWIRLMYLNPDGIDERLIRCVAAESKICRYLDIPLQHADRAVLRRMGRPGDAGNFLELVRRLRRRIPGVALRTTLITGFPGETEAQHRNLLDFVREARFNRLGVFTYSREAGTPAAELPDQVPAVTRQRRQAELLAAQRPISADWLAQQVGRTLTCLVEERSGRRHVLARTNQDAPEVDGVVVVRGQAKPGDLVRVRITGATDHDLSGAIL